MIKVSNFLALVSVLAFIILLRIENTSFESDTSKVAFIFSILSLLLFGSIHLMYRFVLNPKSGSYSGEDKGSEETVKLVKEKIFKLQLLSSPSCIAIGLGVYCLFGSGAENLGSFLASPIAGYGLIVVGVIVEVVILIKLIPLFKEREMLFKRKGM